MQVGQEQIATVIESINEQTRFVLQLVAAFSFVLYKDHFHSTVGFR